MDKKRKRASFTIATPEDEPSSQKAQKEIVSNDEPVMKQVVEVVVKDERKNKANPAPVNIVIPPQKVVVQDTQEKKDIHEEPLEDELPVVDGVDGIDEAPLLQADELMEDDDEETVTASATPDGDTVVLREDTEEEKLPPAPKHYVKSPMIEVVEEVPESTEEEEVKEEIVEEKIQAPPITVHKSSNSGSESVTERQQEQVAELFNKNGHSSMPEITVHKHNQTKGVMLWAITMIAIALGVGGGLVLFASRNNNATPTPIAVTSPTPQAPTPLPSATPTPQAISKSDIKIQVQNGGGKAGAGSRMKSFLEKNGYTVTEVTNADSYTYTATDIVTKASKAQISDILSKDLATEYEVGETSTTLPESSAFDVRVIVGENE